MLLSRLVQCTQQFDYFSGKTIYTLSRFDFFNLAPPPSFHHYICNQNLGKHDAQCVADAFPIVISYTFSASDNVACQAMPLSLPLPNPNSTPKP